MLYTQSPLRWFDLGLPPAAPPFTLFSGRSTPNFGVATAGLLQPTNA